MKNRICITESIFNTMTVEEFLAQLPPMCEYIEEFPYNEYFVENGKLYLAIGY